MEDKREVTSNEAKTTIESILVISDSLTDRGTMANSALAAFSGLTGTSPHGRFTNGYVWLDYLITRLMTGEPIDLIQPQVQTKPSLFAFNTDEFVGTKTAPLFARSYCEGGLTAHDYSNEIRPGKFLLNITAQVLATLDSMRDEAFRDDKDTGRTDEEKLKTLVIEWTGANDMITINNKPTEQAAELAIEARIKNLESMIEAGYRHFVFFNLPDLSLTPRYQNGKAKLREEAQTSVNHFNQRLERKLIELRAKHPECKLNLFDANALFVEAYNNPDQFGLHQDKKHDPFLESRAFKDNDPDTTAEGYMFWDDVHPTEAVHVHLATRFFNQAFAPNYEFQFAKDPLVRQFQKAYGMRWENDKSSWLSGCFRKSRIDHLKSDLELEDIMRHGLFNEGKRTQEVMQSLGWVHGNKTCASDNPKIEDAWNNIQPKSEDDEASRDDATTGIQLQGV